MINALILLRLSTELKNLIINKGGKNIKDITNSGTVPHSTIKEITQIATPANNNTPEKALNLLVGGILKQNTIHIG